MHPELCERCLSSAPVHRKQAVRPELHSPRRRAESGAQAAVHQTSERGDCRALRMCLPGVASSPPKMSLAFQSLPKLAASRDQRHLPSQAELRPGVQAGGQGGFVLFLEGAVRGPRMMALEPQRAQRVCCRLGPHPLRGHTGSAEVLTACRTFRLIITEKQIIS